MREPRPPELQQAAQLTTGSLTETASKIIPLHRECLSGMFESASLVSGDMVGFVALNFVLGIVF